jgi:farnesyl-diphosphate farnesyltransferase
MAIPATIPGESDRAFCRRLLPLVSRTFAACIRLLPRPLDHQVLVAYLLCRIADTVEDCAEMPPEAKERLLAAFGEALERPAQGAPALAAAFAAPRTPDELLAGRADAVLREFATLGDPAMAAVRPWVQEMCRGMAGFVRVMAEARPGRLAALDSLEELDLYCYYVAGTVGHLLTGLFRLHHPRLTARHHARLEALATAFGLGLQLTNIIKDVADDRSRGWSFVPRQLCRMAGIEAGDLLDPAHAEAARRVMLGLCSRARSHLNQALEYCCALPRSAYRIRLFCLTPLYFAVRTLALAERDPRLLDTSHKVKITRGEVHRTICMAYLVAPSNHLVRRYHRQLVGKRR